MVPLTIPLDFGPGTTRPGDVTRDYWPADRAHRVRRGAVHSHGPRRHPTLRRCQLGRGGLVDGRRSPGGRS